MLFVVLQKLDGSKFPGLKRHGSEYYQILTDAGTALLATRETSFKSKGRAFLWMHKVDETVVTMTDGFEKPASVYAESDSADVERYEDKVRTLNARENPNDDTDK